LYGSVVGAIAFIGVEEIVRDRNIVGFMSEHWQILMGAFVILVVLLLRNGLTGLLLLIKRRRTANGDGA
jgi:ABC-type branched-subunit amino acid transport system permease subunit